MMVFVIGPSRSGKTTLMARVLPEFPNTEVLDLDAEEIRRVGPGRSGMAQTGGWEGRWRRNEALLIAAEQRPRETDVVVDVGAGSLQTSEGRRFFIERGIRSIAIVAPWNVVLQRHPGRDPGEFRSTEYSEERQAVYRVARYQVDSSLIVQESERIFGLPCARSLAVDTGNRGTIGSCAERRRRAPARSLNFSYLRASLRVRSLPIGLPQQESLGYPYQANRARLSCSTIVGRKVPSALEPIPMSRASCSEPQNCAKAVPTLIAGPG